MFTIQMNCKEKQHFNRAQKVSEQGKRMESSIKSPKIEGKDQRPNITSPFPSSLASQRINQNSIRATTTLGRVASTAVPTTCLDRVSRNSQGSSWKLSAAIALAVILHTTIRQIPSTTSIETLRNGRRRRDSNRRGQGSARAGVSVTTHYSPRVVLTASDEAGDGVVDGH